MGFRRLWIALLLIVSLSPAAKAEAWMEDYELAQAAARQRDRAVFLFFTGSDWCGWCQRLDREVLTTPQFNAFANPNLVLVKIDFPRRTRLSAEQQAQNDALAMRFHIRGYPTVVVLGGDGKVAGELGYMEGGPGPFIEHLQRLPNIKWHPAGSAPSSPAPPIAANSPAPEFNGAPLVAPKRYTQI